jgi:hypothetical protein
MVLVIAALSYQGIPAVHLSEYRSSRKEIRVSHQGDHNARDNLPASS